MLERPEWDANSLPVSPEGPVPGAETWHPREESAPQLGGGHCSPSPVDAAPTAKEISPEAHPEELRAREDGAGPSRSPTIAGGSIFMLSHQGGTALRQSCQSCTNARKKCPNLGPDRPCARCARLELECKFLVPRKRGPKGPRLREADGTPSLKQRPVRAVRKTTPYSVMSSPRGGTGSRAAG